MLLDKKVCVVTFAGRRQFLTLLYEYLLREKSVIDEWVLCLNTTDPDDVEYIEDLNDKLSPWTRILRVESEDMIEFRRFYPHLCEPGVVYVKLDDDIVWMEPNAIEKLARFRIEHPEYSLVSGNVVNNVLMTFFHQHCGALVSDKKATWDVFGISLHDGAFATEIHRRFIENIKDNKWQKWRFENYPPRWDQRFSINVVSYLGEDLMKFPINTFDDELYLSKTFPILTKKQCMWVGSIIFSHFSFRYQRPTMTDTEELLCEYQKICSENYFIANSGTV